VLATTKRCFRITSAPMKAFIELLILAYAVNVACQTIRIPPCLLPCLSLNTNCSSSDAVCNCDAISACFKGKCTGSDLIIAQDFLALGCAILTLPAEPNTPATKTSDNSTSKTTALVTSTTNPPQTTSSSLALGVSGSGTGGSRLSASAIGGIVGGILGGVLFLIAAGFIFYKWRQGLAPAGGNRSYRLYKYK